jgi:hypothetical protein
MRAVLLFLAILLAAPAMAADTAARDAARATVERQIEAFRRDDAATAYAQAAPAIQNMFPSPDTFLAMVREGYAAVYRARRYSVDRIEETGDDGLALGVTLQPDGAWRISGCRLVKAPGSSA